MHNYCLQRSWGKVMFSQVCVKNSVYRGRVYPSMHWGRHPPAQCMLRYTPCPRAVTPGQTPPWPLQRTVRILRECILVYVWKSCTIFAFWTSFPQTSLPNSNVPFTHSWSGSERERDQSKVTNLQENVGFSSLWMGIKHACVQTWVLSQQYLLPLNYFF